jgi:hypothetical protein
MAVEMGFKRNEGENAGRYVERKGEENRRKRDGGQERDSWGLTESLHYSERRRI